MFLSRQPITIGTIQLTCVDNESLFSLPHVALLLFSFFGYIFRLASWSFFQDSCCSRKDGCHQPLGADAICFCKSHFSSLILFVCISGRASCGNSIRWRVEPICKNNFCTLRTCLTCFFLIRAGRRKARGE